MAHQQWRPQSCRTEGHTKAVIACAWSPDGALLASASLDETVRVWDALTFEQRDLFDDPELQELKDYGLHFSPDARYLAWISSHRDMDFNCTVWKPLTKERPKPLLLSQAHAFSFDPESRRIATAHGIEQNAIPRIWDLTTGVLLAVLAGHTESVNVVSFSPDGRSLLSPSWDGSARIWDAESGEQTASLKEDDKYTFCNACFSPDGKYIATGSSKPSVRLWRTADASCVAEFTEHKRAVVHIGFSPDGEFLASGDIFGGVHIRRLSSFITN
ncbi:WD40-repeat-containing domain protein [Ganoderma leucocontextum]|nr:WD40-repeat-containing domain protein [Ganoderma leucocontextum]